MPAKNSRKTYLENSYYHLYNRGVEKRPIFLDQQDYGVFLSYLKEYLLPKNEKELQEQLVNPQLSATERNRINIKLKLRNFTDEITLLAYCLMPNHFHFFVKQKSSDSIDHFMQSLCTRYAMYFNRKYKRVGSLYQGVYKAVMIENESQFVHLSKYIHKQALKLKGETLQPQQPSSYSQYLGLDGEEWLKPEEVLSYFSRTTPQLSYENFIYESNNFEPLGKLLTCLES
jgi:putative transposase